ncbi:hypothetical protein ACFV30_42170 [Streptomyces sp. NPDC059752]|uniref:hypothetical protein n=1 Tax=unclassified Streptomyces TaxID=2593676 RepID=UPI0036524A00
MRRDTKVVVGILVLALAAVGAIVWRTYRPTFGQAASDGTRRTLPREPCQALTIDDVNAVIAIPEDSYYRTIPVLAWNVVLNEYALGNIGLAFQTDPVSCRYGQSTADTPADPVIQGVETRWAAEWHYAHVAARDWTETKRKRLSDGTCRSAANTAGTQDALWCERHGLIFLKDGMVFGFQVVDEVVPTTLGNPVTTKESEAGARRMAERILRHVENGSFPPPPPTTGPDSGVNMIIRESPG